MQILSIQRKIQARILPIQCSVQRQFSVFQQFSKIFLRKFVKISGLKCQKFSIFIFKKVFSIAFQIVFRFFSLLNNKFFQFEDFQLQIFQAFIFFNFVFTKIFFRLNFVKFKCEFSSDFWRIKIQNFKRNFFRQLHTTFCGLKMWRKCNTKPTQI